MAGEELIRYTSGGEISFWGKFDISRTHARTPGGGAPARARARARYPSRAHTRARVLHSRECMNGKIKKRAKKHLQKRKSGRLCEHDENRIPRRNRPHYLISRRSGPHSVPTPHALGETAGSIPVVVQAVAPLHLMKPSRPFFLISMSVSLTRCASCSLPVINPAGQGSDVSRWNPPVLGSLMRYKSESA